jgi:hypothetical protein
MSNQTHLAYIALSFLVVLTGCGPGPALGLGPALDPVVSLILVVALMVGGYWVVRSAANSPTVQAIGKQISATGGSVRDDAHERTEPPQPSDAEVILRERYARGEIDRKQYLEMMEDLKKK